MENLLNNWHETNDDILCDHHILAIKFGYNQWDLFKREAKEPGTP
jgi:hypothetical protein